MWKGSEELLEEIRKEPWAKGHDIPEGLWLQIMEWFENHQLLEFWEEATGRVEEIIKIDPDLSERRILELATRHMVEFLGARTASVRIFDPQTEQLISYGSYPSREASRETLIPLRGSVAGKVVERGKPFLVPNLLKEPLYRDKEPCEREGLHSMMAIPLEIPRFFPRERDTVAVIQIYYPERDRDFTPLEIQVAEIMARRLSFVIARKKILALYRLNEKKEAIVRKVFLSLGSRGGVKMKEVFKRVIPELADMIYIQSCALFSVTEDRKHVVLEAGYPEAAGYHGIGKRFAVEDEPAFRLVLDLGEHTGESAFDVVTPSYFLVVDPQRSRFLSQALKEFVADHNINSILYVPLEVGERVTHFMTFDALEKRKRYTEEEIEIFLFLGREIMKAQRMERLDDILHDFKNPAIATAGFARRLKALLERGGDRAMTPEIRRCLEILMEETSRLQELALSLYEVGEEQIVNLTERLKKRFEINREAIKEQLRQNVTLNEGPFHDPLHVRCYPLHLERVLDNLLNNATNAIPPHGGILAIRTYADGKWACAEIHNTGRISEEDRLRLLEEEEGRGRGLHITQRIIRLLKGRVDVRVGRETTTFLVKLPRHEGREELSKVA